MNKQEIEKAIAYWKEFKAEIPELRSAYPDAGLDGQEECVDLAMSALEKQIPKKSERLTAGEPVKIGNMTFGKGTRIYKCPGCGTLIARHYVYCNACGQAIDWSVEE